MKVVIAAGGTGGHIYPGIAIANKIRKENPNVQITFVGTQKGLEKDLVPGEGYSLEFIRVKGFRRKLSIDTLKSIGGIFSGLKDAHDIIKKIRPDIVIGTGGYVCGPMLLSAKIHKIPTLIHEQNAFPGITNKLLSRVVDRVAISFRESEKYFKNTEKTILSGNPIRQEFKKSDKMDARSYLGLPTDNQIIVALGGSQGAWSINQSMVTVIKALKDKKNINIIHITGKNQYDKVLDMFKTDGIDIHKYSNIQILPYSQDVAKLYSACDLIISRSGAMTVSEITAVGRPGIFIPFPYATDNHQEFNAKVVADRGGGILILDKDLNGKILLNNIESLLTNKNKLIKMENITKKLGILNGDEIIYNEIMKLIKMNL